MATLRERIQNLRCRNVDSKYFVPAGTLDEVLTISNIEQEVKRCVSKLYRQNEIAKSISDGGRRTFSILVLIHRPELILNFNESDQLQKATLDSRLPFTQSRLESILQKTDAIDFYEKQWEFTAPAFTMWKGHRLLDDDTIFPFLARHARGEGGYGLVRDIEIHPNHGEYARNHVNKVLVVQKQLIESNPQGTETFNRELDVLSFLSTLEHPNIVGLLGSYTFDKTHYLLFPPAAYDLKQLITTNEYTNPFQSESQLLFALCGLSSAIEKMHDYTSTALDIRMIGCHHDLKPGNVLVEGRTLLLADFGLSKLKRASEDSKSPFDRGEGHYLAPECEDPEEEFAPRSVGRASDIWSFGCLLAETATYMCGRGSIGVESFKTQRKVKIDRVTTYTFHGGMCPNPGVQSWLMELKSKASPVGIYLIEIVEDILQIDPTSRPVASDITRRLRRLTLLSRYREANAAFDNVLSSAQTLELEVEKQRYQLLGWAMGLTDIHGVNEGDENLSTHDSAWTTDFSFDICHSRLEQLSKIVDSLGRRDHPRTHLMQLQTLNSNIIHTLPNRLQDTVQRRLEQRMVNTHDQDTLERIKRTFDESSAYRAIGTLAAIRQMHELYRKPEIGTGSELRLDTPILRNQQKVHTFELASLVTSVESVEEQSQQVLIERILYGGHWTEDVGRELFARVGAIADLLRSTSKVAASRVLRCIGFFHETAYHAFGLVFSKPQGYECAKAISLRKLVENSQKDAHIWPTFESRLKLAQQLATTLFEIHTAGWLHKNISAFTIIFFASEISDATELIASPYLIGFNHSRPNDPNAFSHKEETDQIDYRHPEYQEQESRFRAEYDYFSLGMVLLEIGLWRPIQQIMQGKEDLPPAQFLDTILRKKAPMLGFYMGETYRKVVVACLTGHFKHVKSEGSADDEFTSTVNSNLGLIVMEHLDKLSLHIS